MPELPSPLHPALVHLPIALAMLLPVLAVCGAIAISRGWLPARTWAVVLLLHATLAGSAWVAEDVGHDEEEKIEDVVPKDALHEHEEAGEYMVLLAFLTLPITGAGLLGGRAGGAARWLAVLASLALAASALRTGHLGGELVYRYGGAEVYREKTPAP